jgi:nucleoside-diphosphate-sugar epimerase
MMKVTVTGASGRLGSRVCQVLVKAGYTVRATDKLVDAELPVRLEVANLLNREVCYDLLEGADAVIHLGNIPTSRFHDAQTVFSENTMVNMNVFQAATERRVQRILFASSIQVMAGGTGNGITPPVPLPYLPLDGDVPASAGNAYALSKQVSETMLAYFARTAGLTAVAVRFPFLMDDQVMSRVKAAAGKQGGASRAEGFTFLHFLDAATLLESFLRSAVTGFRVYFAASRENTQMRPAPDVIREHFPNMPLRKPLDQIDSLVDLSAIERDTDWSPKFSSWLA